MLKRLQIAALATAVLWSVSAQSQTLLSDSFEAVAELSSNWWPLETFGGGPAPVNAGAPTDFEAIAVTPYGFWGDFTSSSGATGRTDWIMVWSTSPSELTTVAGATAAKNRGDASTSARIYQELGDRIDQPLWTTAMDPGQTYYVAVGVDHFSGEVRDVSNIVQITTPPAPTSWATQTAHPRLVPQAWIDQLRTRFNNGDSSTQFWVDTTAQRVLDAAVPGTSVFSPGTYGPTAALLWHITDDTRYRNAALTLFDVLLERHEPILTRNIYRFNSTDLARTADLMWNELTAAQRQSAMSVLYPDDIHPDNMFILRGDTDRTIAAAMIRMSHALVFRELNAGYEDVIDFTARELVGDVLVRTRLDSRTRGISGGTMEDGPEYMQETAAYWLQMFLTLEGYGFPSDQYAEWVWNLFRANDLYATTPTLTGYFPSNDLDEADSFAEQYSQPWTRNTWRIRGAMYLCLLQHWGRSDQAGYVKHYFQQTRQPDRRGVHEYALLCDGDHIAPRSSASLPTTYVDTGLGRVLSRSAWGSGGSALYFYPGWRIVDHQQADVGDFGLYTGGDWQVVQRPQPGATPQMASVLLIDGNQVPRGVQNAGNRITDMLETPQYLVASADITGAYRSGREDIHSVSQVLRTLVWLKPSAGRPNMVLVLDRVNGSYNSLAQNFTVKDGVNIVPLLGGSPAQFVETIDAVQRFSVNASGNVMATLISDGQMPAGGASVTDTGNALEVQLDWLQLSINKASLTVIR